MPQFNWAVLTPFVLIIALIAGAIFLVGSRLQHPAAQVARHAAAPAEASTARPPAGIQVSGRVTGTPHVRTAPSSNAPVAEDLQSGQTVQVSACSDGCAWYLTRPAGQASAGWVSSAFIDLQGDERKLPVVH